MNSILIFITGLIEAIGISAFLYVKGAKGGGSAQSSIEQIDTVKSEREGILGEIKGLYGQMVDLKELKARLKELIDAGEALKAERGRNTITQAELETVETRLRELEEIERELEASGIETKEELKILNKKEKDLTSKNDALKEQIKNSVAQMDQVISQIQMSSELLAKIDEMKAELVQAEEKIDTILLQIEQGNEQYFILKQRYDALDIEYAQLYEKFSEAEAIIGAKKS